MSIKIFWPWEFPNNLDGIVVIADVWGATTNIATFLGNGVKKLLVVNIKNIQKAKNKYRDALVVGESSELPKSFFNASNYPSDVAVTDVKNKVVLFMSNNGSKVIESTIKRKARKIVTVSFTNIKAISDYLKIFKGNIYLIPSGDIGSSDPKVKEDLICVESLDKIIKGESVDLEKAQEEAEAFIKLNYGDENFDQKRNFRVVFSLNRSDSIPFCIQNEEGFIEIEDLNNHK